MINNQIVNIESSFLNENMQFYSENKLVFKISEIYDRNYEQT